MSTPNAGAEEWAAAQETPWVTLNKSLRLFDAFAVQVIVDEFERNDPPASCADGYRALIGDTPSGDWLAHAGELAVANGANASNGWIYGIVATEMVTLKDRASGLTYSYESGNWVLGSGATIRIQDAVDFDPAGGLADGYVLKWDQSNGFFYPAPDLTSASAPGGTYDIPIMAGAMTARSTSGAAAGSVELTTNKIMLVTLDFDQSTDEFAQFQIPFHKSWNESTITWEPIWTAASGSGDVVWGLQAVALSNDDALDTAMGTATTSTDTLITANDQHTGPTSSALTIGGTPAERDLVIFQVYRDADAGGDTLTADAKLIGIRLHITNNANDDS